jgi:homogentisate 1,2-dioxygenase
VSAKLAYQSGFGNHFESEAHVGALPVGRNNPQKPPLGLYAEQFSATAFTAPVAENRRTWFYRIQPSVSPEAFVKTKNATWLSSGNPGLVSEFNPLRFDALPFEKNKTDFLSGMRTYAVAGELRAFAGCAAHVFTANADMQDFFYNADGELLIVPQSGGLKFETECGELAIEPGEIAVMPRGMKFRVKLLAKTARGYVCENYGRAFRLPERGPIGSNGLANARDFLAPVAAYKNERGNFSVVAKFQGEFWKQKTDHNPLNVVAWHGQVYPYKYDLSRFNAIGTVSFDHPDPSIFTVLTSPSETLSTANVDFVIFPPRWLVAEKTFRPPWYHRNVMSEFMGLVHGIYDAKPEGFVPGGASLHNAFSAHGPDLAAWRGATDAALKPQHLADTLAFMFETRYVFEVPATLLASKIRQKNYANCWKGLPANFRGNTK